MKKYEYMVTRLCMELPGEPAETLNAMGETGWQLVSVFPTQFHQWMVLMREKEVKTNIRIKNEFST